MLRPRRWTDWIALALLVGLVAGAVVSAVWLSRYAVAVHRLTRGIGDTVFYGADGQPWFRLDEQRHDVPLREIAPDLQRAVIAVEDRRGRSCQRRGRSVTAIAIRDNIRTKEYESGRLAARVQNDCACRIRDCP